MIKKLLFSILLSISLTSLAFGQLFENFEDGSKPSYSSDVVNFATGDWLLDDTLIGTDSRDARNGSQSVRIRDGFLQMNFDLSDGASQFSFLAANAGFSGDTGGKLQVELSTDGGATWAATGTEVVVNDQLEEFSLTLEESAPVRFRITKTAGGRINVDDVSIQPFVELAADPTIEVSRGSETLENSSELAFPATGTGATKTLQVEITNNGEPDLSISDVTLQSGTAFSIASDITGTLGSRETATLSLSFSPATVGSFSDEISILTNDPATPEFTLQLSGSAISEDDITPISEARQLEFGTRVTVSGRVTVGNEFDGPSFLQDETAGIAVFWPPFHDAIQRGDSVIVTGPITEFNPIGGTPGTFLLQIAEHEGDDNITFDVVNTEPVEVTPEEITLQEMNTGTFESQLVTVNAVSFDQSGVFQGGTNYDISDFSGSAELRIDQNASDLVNASIPEEPLSITGVVEQFDGVFQLKPRDSQDIQIEVREPVGEDVPKDKTFDVVTWNIEWFGNSGNGPDDLDLQTNNVLTVIRTIDADLYALQEIASEQRFFALIDSLDGYSGFWADYITQDQKMAYIFRSSVIDSVTSGALEAGQVAADWAGRLPFFFEFDATVNGVTRRISSYNIHAKAFGDQDSFNQRQQASLRMKIYLDNNRQNDNVLMIGDYNDLLTRSTYSGSPDSPYKNFVDDETYVMITLPLEERGFASFIAGQNRSMIDHIMVTNELVDDHINGAQRVENPSYIGSFISTTSDHAPVWTRYDFSRSLVSTENDDFVTENPDSFKLNQNYPNPFNPSTNISFTVPERSAVTLTVYDVMGREVATLANNRAFSSGTHTLEFDASSLASGMYIYRLTLNNGMSLSRKMMIVK